MVNKKSKDVILIGAGVLSTTFATLLKNIEPDWNIKLFEMLDKPAIESMKEGNIASTVHAALCELNYKVEQQICSIDSEKAKAINEHVEETRQFWSYLVKNGEIEKPE